MFLRKNIQYYKDVIDGKKSIPDKLYTKGLDYAFDKFVELASEKDAMLLDQYLQGDINVYDSKKYLSIKALGEIAGKQYGETISQFLESKDPHLAFVALCAMCDMYVRNSLGTELRKSFELRMLSILSNENKYADDDITECLAALKKSNYKRIDKLIEEIRLSRPEVIKELPRYLDDDG